MFLHATVYSVSSLVLTAQDIKIHFKEFKWSNIFLPLYLSVIMSTIMFSKTAKIFGEIKTGLTRSREDARMTEQLVTYFLWSVPSTVMSGVKLLSFSVWGSYLAVERQLCVAVSIGMVTESKACLPR